MLYYQEFNPAEGRGNNGKTVVLLHGLGAHSDMWQLQWPVLAEAGYRVIVPDLTGFGRSPYGKGKISVKTLSDNIYDFLKTINVQRAHFVGLSLGGAVTMQFALDHPVIVDKMILSNTAARFLAKGKTAYFMIRFITSKIIPRKTLGRMIATYTFPHPEQDAWRNEFIREFLSANKRAYRRLAASFANYNLTGRVHQIRTPTLIIGGHEDRTLPTHLQEFLHEKIRGSQIRLLNGGHVSAIDNAHEFNDLMLDFLGR